MQSYFQQKASDLQGYVNEHDNTLISDKITYYLYFK